MKTPLALLLLIPSLSWGLTFKDGKQVDSEVVSETTLKDNFQSSNNKSIFISDSELNEFFESSSSKTLSVLPQVSSCNCFPFLKVSPQLKQGISNNTARGIFIN